MSKSPDIGPPTYYIGLDVRHNRHSSVFALEDEDHAFIFICANFVVENALAVDRS